MTSAIPLVRHCPSSPPTCGTCGSFDRISETKKEYFRFYLNKSETSLFGLYELPRFWIKYLHWFFLIAACFLLVHPNSWKAQRKFVMWIKITFYVFSSPIKTASPSLHSSDITHAGSERQFTPRRDSYLKRGTIKAKLQDWPSNYLEGNILLLLLFFLKYLSNSFWSHRNWNHWDRDLLVKSWLYLTWLYQAQDSPWRLHLSVPAGVGWCLVMRSGFTFFPFFVFSV